MSIGGGSNQLDKTNCSKQCTDRIGITETESRKLSVGTYRVRPKGQDTMYIAPFLNKNESLTEQTAQKVRVGNTEIPNQRTL